MRDRLTSRRLRASACALALALASSTSSCTQDCPVKMGAPRSGFTVDAGEVSRIAEEISRGVGKVVSAGNGSVKRTVYVFEESHTSRLGQLETALMMLRLRERHNLRAVSLEGAIADRGELPSKWFHDLPSKPDAVHAKERVAVRLLREGEISNGEFISLVRPDVRVKGNEVEAEYRVEHPEKGAGAWGAYLFAIAGTSLTQSQVEHANELSRMNRDKELVEYVIGADPWAKERYQKLSGGGVGLSIEETLCLFLELVEKAEDAEVSVDQEAKDGLREQIEFYRVATKRSHTMVENTFAMADAAPGAPVALIIGAAHTEKVVELLKEGGASYAVISSNAWAERAKVGNLTADAYKRKLRAKSVDEGKLLGARLSVRKPPGVLDKQWLRSKTQLYHLLFLLADDAGGGGKPPFDKLSDEFASFDSLEFDPSSIKVKKVGGVNYLIFKVLIRIDDSEPGRKVELWPAVWMDKDDEPGLPDAVSFEEMLLEKTIVEVRQEEPPPSTGPVTAGASSEQPKTPQPLVISKGVKAVFETSEEGIMQAISGV